MSVPERETTPTLPFWKMLPGMMPILHSPGVSTPGQLGPISRDFDRQRALDPDHVEHRNALGDADDQRHLGVDRLEDRVRGEGRRHVDDAGVAPVAWTASRDGVEHRQAEVRRAALPGVTPPTICVP